ncbi:MAG TPA: hypothetical protein VFP30_06710, partial [Candidatus Limnocylindria bacterium]|nr:hypothetical protein [Candidatus Limnocylindria bacterium]
LRRLSADLCERLADRHLAPGRAVLTLRMEDAPAIRVSQPFPQPALEPDWIARLLLSRLEAAARGRRSSLPNVNQDALRRALSATQGSTGTSNLDKSMTSDGAHRTGGWHSSPKAAAIGIWQEPQEPLPEPRVASVLLVFDRLTDPASRQLPVFEVRAGRWEELRWSLERIRHRFGEGRLWRARVDRPHAALPEHRWRLQELHE